MYFTARLIVHRARTGGDMLVCAMRHARTAMSKSVSARLAQRIWNQAAPIVFLIFLCAACTHAQSSPTITSVSPTTGGAGTVIEVYGSNFGGSQGSSTVTINGTSLGTSSYWTQGRVQFTLPSGLSSGNLVATVGGTASNGISFTIPPPSPSITSVSPTTGGAGTVIEVYGSNFGSSQGSSAVTINGSSLGTSSYWTQGQAQFTLPSGLNSGNLVATVGGTASNAISFTISTTPTITSVSPTTGGVGTVIEVYGSNFGGSQGSSTVTINGTSLGTSSYWTQGQAQFTLPAGLSSGNLVVNVGGTATNGIPFTYAIPPSITSSVSPAPNSGGWLNRNATVTFTCTAGTYPIASCPSPQTVSSDGLGQIVSGTVVDTAGDMATASATINLDKTIPTLAVSSPADQTVESSSAVTVSGTLTDALSGVT